MDMLTEDMQVINIYRQIIPQFDGFLLQLGEADRQALQTTYKL